MSRLPARAVRGAVKLGGKGLAAAAILLVRLYQAALSPLMGGHCRFHPTCSEYAVEAFRVHGFFRGAWLTARRLGRCRPLGGGGYDPVPLPSKRAG